MSPAAPKPAAAARNRHRAPAPARRSAPASWKMWKKRPNWSRRRAAAASRAPIAAAAPRALAPLRGQKAKARGSATVATSWSRRGKAKLRRCAPAVVEVKRNAAPARRRHAPVVRFDQRREYNLLDRKERPLMTDYERYGEYQPSERSALGTGITMLLIGLGAGALTALLLAPRSGKQTRKLIRRKYDDTVEDITERADEIRERGTEWLERAKDFAGSVSDTAEEARERVKAFSKEARKRAER